MTIEEHIKYWLDSSENDWLTAKTLLNNSRYDWSLFLGHLVLEKVLKAHYVKTNNNTVPPKTHNLLKLAELAKVELSEDKMLFLDEINDFNLEVRYPEYKNEFYKKCDKDFAEGYLKRIEEMNSWLKSLLR